MKKEWYDITDIEKFVASTRVLVFLAFANKEFDIESASMEFSDLSIDEQHELDGCLSMNECMCIAKDFIRNKTSNKQKTNKYFISDMAYKDFIDALSIRMTANLLHKLSNDGILDSAFDEELNDFVFWTKDE